MATITKAAKSISEAKRFKSAMESLGLTVSLVAVYEWYDYNGNDYYAGCAGVEIVSLGSRWVTLREYGAESTFMAEPRGGRGEIHVRGAGTFADVRW